LINFYINSVLLGVGIAMDAFSVSLANGLNDPKMKKRKMLAISGVFSFFQAIMPLIGWCLVQTVIKRFKIVANFVPCIALVLLTYLGLNMIFDGVKNKKQTLANSIGIWGVLVQAVATSIDALSVGFTISSYNLMLALLSSLIIFVIAFIICNAGFYIGKKFGNILANKASIIGGIILILIGIEIFIIGLL